MSTQSTGFGKSLRSNASGAPFAAGSANNGLSVDAVTGKIVMGNDVAGVTAALLSNREIPMAGFNMFWSGIGNTVMGSNVNGGGKLQLIQSLTGVQNESAMRIAATWNTTGVPTLISGTVTDTASNVNSLLMDVRATGEGRLRLFKNGGLTLSGPVNANYVVITPTNIAAGGSSGGAGQTTQVNLLPRYFQASGAATLNAIAIQGQIQQSGGTGDTIDISLQNNVNQSGAYAGDLRGIYYNPTLVAMNPGNRNIAWENSSGEVFLNTVSGVTSIGPLLGRALFADATPGAITVQYGDIDTTSSGTRMVLADVSGTIDFFARTGLTVSDGAGMFLFLADTSNKVVTTGDVNNVLNGSAVKIDDVNRQFTVFNGVGQRQIFADLSQIITTIGDVDGVASSTAIKIDDSTKTIQFSSSGGAVLALFNGASISASLGDLALVGNGTVFQVDDGTSLVSVSATSGLLVTSANGIKITGDTVLLHTGTALANGAGALIATLTNAPAAGNPTKWIPIDDNGTTRFIPAW